MKFIKKQNNLIQIELENGETVNVLVIPEGIEKVYGRAFMGLNDIKELSLPSTFKGFIVEEESDFLGLPRELIKISVSDNNPLYKVTSGCLINVKSKRIEFATSEAIIPQNEGIEEIGDYVFNQHFNISEFIIPASVKKLGYMSLSGTGAKSIYFLGALEYISPCALISNCELNQIVMPQNDKYEVKDGCVVETVVKTEVKKGKTKIKKIKTLLAVTKKADKIPHGVSIIEKGVFTYMPMEKDVELPATVNEIKDIKKQVIVGGKKFKVKEKFRFQNDFKKCGIYFKVKEEKDENNNNSPIIRILHILQEYTDAEHPLISNKIVDKLFDDYGIEMGRKAVESNIHTLQKCGYAIEHSRKGWYMDARDFNDTVLQHLIESVLFSKYISNDDAKDLVGKLSKLGSPSLQKNAKAVSRVGTTYHAPKANEYFLSLGQINDAIDKDRKISFLYGDYEIDGAVHFNNQVKVVVNPYKILVTNGFYYLLAVKEGEKNARHYRLDKMSKVEILLSSYRKPITDTELKGFITGEYLAEHSKMFSGKSIGVSIKIKKDKISHVIDTFGTKFTFVKETNNHYIIKVKSNENDVYYWALQFGEIAEIVEPQDLRDRIRTAVEELSMRYLQSDGDRYEDAINNAKRDGKLDLQGIDLSKIKDRHSSLKNIREVLLSDNNLSDIAFLQNYKDTLVQLKIYNNPIKDITNLSGLSLRNLELCGLPLYDISPLKDVAGLEKLKLENITARDFSVLKDCNSLRDLEVNACNDAVALVLNDLTGLERLSVSDNIYEKLDLDKIKNNNLCIKLYKSLAFKVYGYLDELGTCLKYPENVLYDAFGDNKRWVGDMSLIKEEIEKMFDKLLPDEKSFAKRYYKEEYTAKYIADVSEVSIKEIQRIRETVKRKISHKSYNQPLEKFVDNQ